MRHVVHGMPIGWVLGTGLKASVALRGIPSPGVSSFTACLSYRRKS